MQGMEFTPDQYLALVFIAISTVVFGAVNYWSGRLDRRQLRAYWQGQYERQVEVNEQQRQAIARNRLNADSLRTQLAHMTEAVSVLEARQLTDSQCACIERAAHQLEMCAQLMTAMKNHENAKTQRALAAQLTRIAGRAQEQAA
ncbi:MAG: hypothetical protein GX665_12590 [Gammaproteobacteria bacterium]|nr:hypothetical protein [Gammaproteobacteria bacterium]